MSKFNQFGLRPIRWYIFGGTPLFRPGDDCLGVKKYSTQHQSLRPSTYGWRSNNSRLTSHGPWPVLHAPKLVELKNLPFYSQCGEKSCRQRVRNVDHPKCVLLECCVKYTLGHIINGASHQLLKQVAVMLIRYMLSGVFIARIMYIIMIDCKFDISRETCTKKDERHRQINCYF